MVSDNDVRDVQGDVNKLSSFMSRPQYLQTPKITEYLVQADNLLSDKAKVFDHNSTTKASRDALIKSMEVCLQHLANKGQPAPALKNISSGVSKKVDENDARTLKGDVSRLSSNMDRPQYLQPAKMVEYLTQSDNMLSEKAEVFDFDASTKAAKAQLEKSMGVLIQHMVNTKQTLPVLKNVSTSASKQITDADVRSLTADMNRLTGFLNSPQYLQPAKLNEYLQQAETALQEKADIFAFNAATQTCKSQLEKSIAIGKAAVKPTSTPAPQSSTSSSSTTTTRAVPTTTNNSNDSSSPSREDENRWSDLRSDMYGKVGKIERMLNAKNEDVLNVIKDTEAIIQGNQKYFDMFKAEKDFAKIVGDLKQEAETKFASMKKAEEDSAAKEIAEEKERKERAEKLKTEVANKRTAFLATKKPVEFEITGSEAGKYMIYFRHGQDEYTGDTYDNFFACRTIDLLVGTKFVEPNTPIFCYEGDVIEIVVQLPIIPRPKDLRFTSAKIPMGTKKVVVKNANFEFQK